MITLLTTALGREMNNHGEAASNEIKIDSNESEGTVCRACALLLTRESVTTRCLSSPSLSFLVKPSTIAVQPLSLETFSMLQFQRWNKLLDDNDSTKSCFRLYRAILSLEASKETRSTATMLQHQKLFFGDRANRRLSFDHF